MALDWNLSDCTVAEFWQHRREEAGLVRLTSAQLATAIAMSAACADAGEPRPHPWTAMRWASHFPLNGVDANPRVWRTFVADPPHSDPFGLLLGLIAALGEGPLSATGRLP